MANTQRTKNEASSKASGNRDSSRPQMLAGMAVGLLILAGIAWYFLVGPGSEKKPTQSAHSVPEVDRSNLSSELNDLLDIWYDAVEESPDVASSWGMLGQALYANGFLEEGAQCFEVARELSDSQDERFPYYIGIHLESSDPTQAESLFREAIELAEHPNVIRLRLAELLFSENRLDDCRSELEIIEDEIGDNDRALMLEARIELQEGDPSRARELAELAMEGSPNRGDLHQLLSQIYFELGETLLAQQFASQSELTSPEWPDFYFDDVLVLATGVKQLVYKLDRPDTPLGERILILQKAVEEEPHIPSWFGRLANALMSAQQFDEADRVIRQGIQRHNDSAELHYIQGLVLVYQQSFEQACQSFDTAINLKPDYFEAFVDKGIALRELTQLSESIEAFRDALRFQSTNEKALFNLAYTLDQFGDPGGALIEYEKMIELETELDEPYLEAARLLMLANQRDKAIQYLDQLLQRNPTHEQANVLRQQLSDGQ